MRLFLTAFSTLTVIPVCPANSTGAELRRSLNLFPAVGLAIGALLFAAAWALSFLPPAVYAAVLALLPELPTCGFHLDGLADSADGMLSGRTRERKLEIMHDSRLGTMGALALFSVLGLRTAVFYTLPVELCPAVIALAALTGRCEMVWYIAFSESARPDGIGKIWFGGPRPWVGLAAAAILPLCAGGLLFYEPGLTAAAAAVGCAWIWSRVTRRSIGGATGDTIGASEVLCELLVLLLALWWTAPVTAA